MRGGEVQLLWSWIIGYLPCSRGYYVNIGSVIIEWGQAVQRKDFLVSYFALYSFISTHETLLQGKGPFTFDLDF